MTTSIRPVLFYDGRCGLCHRAVRVLLWLDTSGRLTFAPLGGETFLARVVAAERSRLPDSLVLLTADGRLCVRSRAVIEALRLAGGASAWLARAASLVPSGLADRLYDRLANTRRRLFAEPLESCPVPPGRWRGRFLP